MRQIGSIGELWRYPVSSVAGERLDHAEVSVDGVVGDRRFALVEVATGTVAHPERDQRWHKAIFVKSRTTATGGVEVQVPDQDWLAIGAPHLAGLLSAFFGFEVTVRPYERSGYGTAEPEFAVNRYDVAPLHLLTSASVEYLKSIHPDGDPDRRRFRPNIFVKSDIGIKGFAELDWIGRPLRLGAVSNAVVAPTKRCGFTIIAQEGLENDPEMLRNVIRYGNRNMGVYCRPGHRGILRVGDAVLL
ncbi:MOSC domain-containing protein [Rhizobium sullae]|uniref:MOSC domain-containing protein n=1 Tax=Rhizobium sullae TaxID=50338 RepID=UPI000B34B2DB|nr:MOSC N-terminal beta barrel domain-containing protein [Rhizobium sullae]